MQKCYVVMLYVLDHLHVSIIFRTPFTTGGAGLGHLTFGCYRPVAITSGAQFHNLFGPLSKVTLTL